MLLPILSTEFSRQEYWSGWPFPFPGHLPDPGIEPRSPALQADSFLSELPGKLKNTGVGSRSFLQGTFPTQESNQGLLHRRRILYQLSYEGSPMLITHFKYSSLYTSIPNSITIPPLNGSLLVTISSFSKSVSLFLFCK